MIDSTYLLLSAKNSYDSDKATKAVHNGLTRYDKKEKDSSSIRSRT